MTGWRHTELPTFPGQCAGCLNEMAQDSMTDNPFGIQSACTTPTPDPASPCGFEDPWAKYGHPFPPCGRPETHTHHTFSGGRGETPDGGHFYRPTRCTCGHAIEAAPQGDDR